MKKSIGLLLMLMVLLSMIGCNNTAADSTNENAEEEQMTVLNSDEPDENTADVNGSEKGESIIEEIEGSEDTETQETEQEPELSDEEKHAALMEEINYQIEFYEMINSYAPTGLTYACFYDETSNSFTSNTVIEDGCDSMAFSSFDDLIDSTNSSSKSLHDRLGIDCYDNLADGTIVLYSSLNGVENTDLTLVKLSLEDPEPTFGEQNALKSAESYLSFMAFSHSGLIKQLEFEGYSNIEATYAADRCGANWCEQAAKSAESYLKSSAFSQEGLIKQLEYEGFTETQAKYGAAKNGYGYADVYRG